MLRSHVVDRLYVAKIIPKEMLIASDTSPRMDAPVNSDEIAIRLLSDVGLDHPDADDKQRALQAYDTLVSTLEEIRDEALH